VTENAIGALVAQFVRLGDAARNASAALNAVYGMRQWQCPGCLTLNRGLVGNNALENELAKCDHCLRFSPSSELVQLYEEI
jgi:hypothetical protein